MGPYLLNSNIKKYLSCFSTLRSGSGLRFFAGSGYASLCYASLCYAGLGGGRRVMLGVWRQPGGCGERHLRLPPVSAPAGKSFFHHSGLNIWVSCSTRWPMFGFLRYMMLSLKPKRLSNITHSFPISRSQDLL